MTRIALLLLAAQLAVLPRAHAADTDGVDVALVLVDDVSRSINDDEYSLQKHGYFTAFTDPNVIAAIRGGTIGRIAVAYVEFASEAQVRLVLDWSVISDEASAQAFATAIAAAPRSFSGRTAISSGIDEAMHLFSTFKLPADRRVIDVCGDGTNNSGRPVTEARDDAARQGVVINGLALANESNIPWLQAHTHPPGGLGTYYRTNVTSGEGSFVIEIHSFESFTEAVTRKLIEEISLATPPVAPHPG